MWQIQYITLQGRETVSRQMDNRKETIAQAVAYEKQGCTVQFLIDPQDKRISWGSIPEQDKSSAYKKF